MLLHVFLYLLFGAFFVAYTLDLKKSYGVKPADGKLELIVAGLLWPIPIISSAARWLATVRKSC